MGTLATSRYRHRGKHGRKRAQRFELQDEGWEQPTNPVRRHRLGDRFGVRSSFFWAFTHGRTYSGDISRTSCPISTRARARYLPCRNLADLPEAHVGDNPVEA